MNIEEQEYLEKAENAILRFEKRVEELAIRLVKFDFKFDPQHKDFHSIVDELEKINEDLDTIKREGMRWYTDNNEQDKDAYDVYNKAFRLQRTIYACEKLVDVIKESPRDTIDVFEEIIKRQTREINFLKGLLNDYKQINDPLPKDVVKQEIVEAISMASYVGILGTNCRTTLDSEKQELNANIREARQTAEELASILIEKLQS